MNYFSLPIVLLIIATSAAFLPAQEIDPQNQWAGWRGPLATGEAPAANPPLTWSETENVAWKTELPGKGHSTPIVWGDTVIVTAAEPFGEQLEPRYSGAPGAHDNVPVSQHHRFLVIAVDRRDGTILWQKQVHQALPHEGAHYTGSLASASPVTDGQHIVAYFGSWGVYCLDFDGNVVWEKSLGTMNTKHGHGEGASPFLHDGKLVVNWDHEGESFIAAFESTTGDELWRVSRAESTSWSSPIVVEHDGRAQVIVAGTNRVRGYDLADGSVIWECGGLSDNVVATPVAADGMVIVGSSYEKRAMFGIKLDGAQGDITDTDHVVWFTNQRTPYVPSPLLYRGSVYFLRHYQGVLTRLDAATGEERIGPFRLDGLRDIYASPVAADGRIYVTDRDGVTIVFSHVDDEAQEVPRMMSANRLDDQINSSLALAGEQIFVRGKQYWYCIGEE
ncbi:MAG: PQQ-binding-like beta-propeller repeat protein [Pirellulaceae bacterium]